MTDIDTISSAEDAEEAKPVGLPKPLPRKRGRKKGDKHGRITSADWMEIYQQVRNGVSVAAIAKAYSCQKSTIYRKLKGARIKPGVAKSSAEAAAAEAEREALIGKIRETKDNDYKFTSFLQRKVMHIVTEAEKAHKPMGAVMDDIKAVKAAIEAINAGTNNKWRILGLDKENSQADLVLPELPIRELTPAEMIIMRDRQALEDLDDAALERLDAEPDPEDIEEEGLSDEDLAALDLEDEDEGV